MKRLHLSLLVAAMILAVCTTFLLLNAGRAGAAEPSSPSSTVSWITNTDGFWDVAGNWDCNCVPGLGDDVSIAQPANITITVRTDAQAVHSVHIRNNLVVNAYFQFTSTSEISGNLTLNTDLHADGPARLSGNTTWSAGTMYAGSGVTNTGTIALAGSGGKNLAGTLNNLGAIVQQDTGNLNAFGNGLTHTLNNLATGIYDFQSDASIFTGCICTFIFNNSGIIRKSVGSGSIIRLAFQNLGGTVNVLTGTLRFDGDGGVSTGGGAFNASTSAVLDIATGDNASYAGLYSGSGGGTVLLESNLHIGSSGVTLNFPPGMFQWTNGVIYASSGLTNTGTLVLAGSGSKALAGGTFNNFGTIVHGGTGVLNEANGWSTALNNLAGGLYDFQSDASITPVCCGTLTFNNFGTIQKSVGSFSAIRIAFQSQGGSIDVLTGTLQLDGDGGISTGGGTFNVSTGTSLNIATGDNASYAGLYTGSGAGTVLLETNWHIGSNGATLNFPPGMFQWTNGVIYASSGLTNTGTLVLAGSGSKALAGGTFNNFGTIVHGGTGVLNEANGWSSALNNLAGGLYDFQSDASITPVCCGTLTFNNFGTIQKSVGSFSAIRIAFQSQGGSSDVLTGTLQLDGDGGISTGGGTFNVSTGTSLNIATGDNASYAGLYTGSGAGTVQLSYNLHVGSSPATFNFPPGMFQWLNGVIYAGSGLTNTGTLRLAGSATKALAGTLNNSGTIIHADTGELHPANGWSSTLNILAGGQYDFQSDVNIHHDCCGSLTINNYGTLGKSAGSGGSTVAVGYADFPGAAIHVQSGTLVFGYEALTSGIVFNTLANIMVGPNATLASSGDFLQSYGVASLSNGTLSAQRYQGGTIAGAGTLVLSNGVTGGLLLQPGAQLQFASGQGLTIANGGALFALGTVSAPITFTGMTNTAGAWQGIRVQSGGAALLDNCSLAYGGNAGAPLLSIASSNVALQNCAVHDSSADGIDVSSAQPALAANSIYSNAFGLRNTSGITISAVNNWWGAASGPFHATRNPAGTGNAVSDYVLFNPWLTSVPTQSVPSNQVVVIVGGPGFASPGETVDFSIAYANLTTQTVQSAVLVMQLPQMADYLDNSGGGIVREALNQIFWKLGDVAPGAAGLVSVKVRYRWGLTPHTIDSTGALFAGTNYNQSAFDVGSYLNYAPLVIAQESYISRAQFDNDRLATPAFNAIYTQALASGFIYVAARNVGMTAGQAFTQAVLLKPDLSSVMFLTREGDQVLAITVDRSSVTVSSSVSMFSIDPYQGIAQVHVTQAIYVPGAAAPKVSGVNSPADLPGNCLATCGVDSLALGALSDVSGVIGKLSTLTTCLSFVSDTQYDPLKGANCGQSLVKTIPGSNSAFAVLDCIRSKIGNPAACNCTADKYECGHAFLGLVEGVLRIPCNNGTYDISDVARGGTILQG